MNKRNSTGTIYENNMTTALILYRQINNDTKYLYSYYKSWSYIM